MAKALIAMSGGVDSSVAACLCKQKGMECIGCTMQLHEKNITDTGGKACGTFEDAQDARKVAESLGMPFHLMDFSKDFKEKVIDYFVETYLKGQTPNPCIQCNKHMKFARLHETAREMGCDYVVTGHYARIVKEGDKYLLKKGMDEGKDQSYVLYNLTQEQLSHTLFPLGELTKVETRKIAEKMGFVNANKPDSQDICFVPDGDYASVIKKYTGSALPEGNFISPTGEFMGKHKGIIHYTIGQRKGLGVTFGMPKYVCKIDPKNNTVVLGDNEDLFKKEVKVENINWILGEAPEEELRCTAKVRYNQKEKPATLIPNGTKATLIFDEPQRAITPGQAAVFYIEDGALGGGTIVD